MPLDVRRLLAWNFPDLDHSYSRRDTMLYALGLGFGENPIDLAELRYVYEEGLMAAPSMATILGHPGFWLRDPRTGVDWKKVVHAEQWLELFRPLPVEGRVIGRTRIDGIADKGPIKGAMIYSTREIVEAESGDILARASMTTLARGDGGFGGENLASPYPTPPPLPERAPDQVCDFATLPSQALIYRLSGDYNPLHVDPTVARAAGFDRPILHGLATYGMACRAVLKTLCEYDATRLSFLYARFSAPVYPGETVRFDIWLEGADVRFQAFAPARGVRVLDNGAARIA